MHAAAYAANDGFLRAFDFRGRTSRRDYWFFVLFTVVVFVGAFVLDAITGQEVFSTLWGLIILLPSYAALARRFHDTNRSGWFVLLCLIPLLGLILVLVWGCEPSQPGPNRYGPEPGKLLGKAPERAPLQPAADNQAAEKFRFNPAPGWPAPPPGWHPAADWRPPASWPTAPPGWRYLVPAHQPGPGGVSESPPTGWLRSHTALAVAVAWAVVATLVTAVLSVDGAGRMSDRSSVVAVAPSVRGTTAQPPSPLPRVTSIPAPGPSFTVPETTGAPTLSMDGNAADQSTALYVSTTEVLNRYFAGINSGDYASAWGTYSRSLRARIPYDEFADGVATSQDTDVQVHDVRALDSGTALAHVTFTGHQDPSKDENGYGCTEWDLSYRMVLEEGQWRIDKVTAFGPGPAATPCD